MDAQHGFRQVPLGRGNVNDMEKNDSSGYGYLGIPEHAVRLRLSLAKSPVLTANIKFAAMQALLLHILYTRGVIPCLAQELLSLKTKATPQFSRDESSNGCKKQPRKEERKRRAVLQCASELEALLTDLNQVFDQNCSQITSVVMTLGPSIMSPREQYVIVFHDAASVGLDGEFITEQRKRIGISNRNEFAMQKNAASKDKIQREISRRIIQEFLRGTMEASNMFASPVAKVPPSSRKLNIAFLFKNDSPAQFNHLSKKNVMKCPSKEKENIQSKTNVSKNDEKAQILNNPNDACLVVRRNFSIRTPRMVSKKKNIHRPFVILDIAPMKSASSSDENFQEQGGQWMSLRRTLKGFRH
uniref:Uncharacterized protein n=1 Tax=Attheya septentrionalis TaxID=420275 RepID=A0A6T7GJ10_9STRA|mmetsp:Transcript_15709/g.28571  ORF Transcript_15709/g.28571 Transcript_15709/m.28571 type:complete len:357 (+) Transcript_15709:144-1214(+)